MSAIHIAELLTLCLAFTLIVLADAMCDRAMKKKEDTMKSGTGSLHVRVGVPKGV